MQYQTVCAHTLPQLETLVNNEIKHGWEVTGGLISFTTHRAEMKAQAETHFAQAMIKHGAP